jgi:predicted kinase
MTTPFWHLICGSTGAGKTSYAAPLAQRLGGVHFSIDDWMARLFWMDSPQPIQFEWTIERVRRCEDQIVQTALALAARGVPAILDLGFSAAEHRARIAAIGRAAGVEAALHLVDVPADERWRRVQVRNAERGETWRLEVTREMFDFMEDRWEPPTDAEMAALNGVRA